MATEYKAVQVGNTWGVQMNDQTLWIGVTEQHAKAQVRDLRKAQYELEAEARRADAESDSDDRARSGYYGSR